MDISVRLKTIVNLIDKCESIADIGTDHGYVPIDVIKNNICNNAISSDINKGPVEKAKINVSMEGMKDKIECRLGPGLTTLKVGEVQGVVIAGMGGNLIRDIILQGYNIFKKLDFAILQPTQNPEVLRKFLFEKGLEIIKEDLCIDEGIYYEIMKVKCQEFKNPIEKNEIYYEISEYLVETKHPIMKQYICDKIKRYKLINDKIRDTTESALKRKKDIEFKINKLEGIKECL